MRKVKLKDIAEINPRKSEIDKEAVDEVSFVAMADVSEDGFISEHETRSLSEVYSGYTYFKKGDVLLAKITPCFENGKAAIADNIPNEIGFGSSEFHVFRTNGKVLPKYLFYALWNEPFREYGSKKMTGSAGQKRVPTNFLKNYEIPLPSLSEQKTIVAKLDRAQRLIDIDREMLAKYDELIQSVFFEMFGDPRSNSKKIKTGKLGDYSFINMGQSPKGSSYNEEGKGEPLLNGPTEFGEKYPQEKQWTTEPKKFAEIDDILFCVRGATAGRTNLADKKYCIGRGLAAIRGEEKLGTTFIHFVLKSHYDYFQNQGQGSTFINIAKKDLSNLEVPIPSQALQNEFISASKEIENQKQVTKESLKKSEKMFSSLVQEAYG